MEPDLRRAFFAHPVPISEKCHVHGWPHIGADMPLERRVLANNATTIFEGVVANYNKNPFS
jgi:hypothetical protein